MINESKKRDARSWKKWDESGATSPSQKERAEKEAEQWLRQEYDFDTSLVPEEVKRKFIEEYEASMKERKELYSTYPTASRQETLDKITEQPTVTLENQDKHGTTNNFWNQFFPEIRMGIKNNLAEGSLAKEKESSYNMLRYGPSLLYWQMKDILMPAFEKIGYNRIKKMHTSLETYLELDREWKQRLGENPHRLWYGAASIPESPLIPEEEKYIYTAAELDFTNTLRVLALELVDRGVPFSNMHG